jgi:type II secretory pathway pseudopilin PulG
MIRKPRMKHEGGFSIAEMTVAMTLSVVVAGIATVSLARSFQIRKRENKRADAVAEVQRALNIMSRDIANAGFGLRSNGIVNEDSDSSSIRVRANLNAFDATDASATVGSASDPDEDVEYVYHIDNNGVGHLVRYDVGTGNKSVLAKNLTDFEIFYFDRKIDYTEDPTGGIIITTPNVIEVTDQTLARYIVITAMVNLPATGSPGTQGYQPASQTQLISDVVLRNTNLAQY